MFLGTLGFWAKVGFLMTAGLVGLGEEGVGEGAAGAGEGARPFPSESCSTGTPAMT